MPQVTFNGSREALLDEENQLVVFGPQYHQTSRIVLISLMIAFSLIGNGLVCFRLLTSGKARFRSRLLFLHLAVADLLVTLVTMTSQVIWEVMGRLWIAGDVFCRTFKILQTFVMVSSIYMLVSIALDRHYVIVWPLRPAPGQRPLALAAWIASLLPSLPTGLLFREVQVEPGTVYCASVFYTWPHSIFYRQLYMGFVLLSVFIIPFVLLIVLYTRTVLALWKQSLVARQQTASLLPKAKIKTLKMTLVIFAAFVITNAPYVVQELVLAFGSGTKMDENLVAFFGVMSASNSAVNPYIYLTFHGSCCGGAWMWCREGSGPKQSSVVVRSEKDTLRSSVNVRRLNNLPLTKTESLV